MPDITPMLPGQIRESGGTRILITHVYEHDGHRYVNWVSARPPEQGAGWLVSEFTESNWKVLLTFNVCFLSPIVNR